MFLNSESYLPTRETHLQARSNMALLLQLTCALSLFIFNHNVLQCLAIVDVSLTCCCVEVYKFLFIQLSSVDGVSARTQTAVLLSLVIVSFRW